MKISPKILAPVFLCAGTLTAQEKPWQVVTDPTAAEVAKNFASPPPEYSSQITWGWGGNVTREVIARDLDRIQAMNIHAAWVEPSRPAPNYLSPGYFETVKAAVEEAKARNMRLWFDDDGGYPSGFAGGKFTEERPELQMKALVSAEQIPVAAGENFTRVLVDNVICALVYNSGTGAWQVLDTKNGEVNWTAPNSAKADVPQPLQAATPSGNWTVVLPRWTYRSGPTRSANNSSGQKDTEHSLMDFLEPAAGKLFIQWTFEEYKNAVGDEFGKTLLGFRGDEASYGFNPWSLNFPAEFQARKGYDIRPFLPAIAALQIPRGGRGGGAVPEVSLDAAHRAYADYSDVWSSLFSENFFAAEGQWCAANGMQMQTHIEHEEILPQLAISNGDFFKNMRHIQVPGIDVIWHQLWHDVPADFPKLASSAAHLFGNPLSMSESFAAMSGQYPTPNLDEVGWILNHQMMLGITHFEYMFLGASASRSGGAVRLVRAGGAANGAGGAGGGQRGAPPPDTGAAADLPLGQAPNGYRYLNDPKFPELAAYVNRVTYVLAQGRPAAQIGVYIPSSSFWFGDLQANTDFHTVVAQLLENQREMDFVDEQSLASVLKLRGGELVNLSGQGYRAIIIPPVTAISKAALENLRAFAKAGGKVVVLGHPPTLVMDKNFLTATGPADMSWAVLEPAAQITPKVLAALPAPDVKLDQPAEFLRYTHRHLKDAEVYFLFNEGLEPVNVHATLAADGAVTQAQVWNAHDGTTANFDGATFSNHAATVPLKLARWETKVVVLTSGPASAPVALAAR